MKTELEKCMAGETFTADSSTLDLALRRNYSDNPNPAFWCNTFSRPIRIEDEVWLGGGAILLPGVTVGKGSVVGA